MVNKVKFWPTKKLKEIIDENYNRGIHGKDYQPLIEEIKEEYYKRIENLTEKEIKQKEKEMKKEIKPPRIPLNSYPLSIQKDIINEYPIIKESLQNLKDSLIASAESIAFNESNIYQKYTTIKEHMEKIEKIDNFCRTIYGGPLIEELYDDLPF